MRVLVTRAAEDAARTAEALAALGYGALVSPLIETRAIDAPVPQGDFDAVLLTSAKAAPHLGGLRTHPILAVGARTADAARAAGAGDVAAADGDATALAALVAARVTPGARLLHLAGEDRKPEPEASLAAAGYRVVVHPVYRAVAVPLSEAARQALERGEIAGALHYSRRTSALFVAALRDAGLASSLLRLLHGAISEDAAFPLRAGGASHIVVPERPRESALLRSFADAAGVAFGAR